MEELSLAFKMENQNTHLTPTQEITATPVEKEILERLDRIETKFANMEKHDK